MTSASGAGVSALTIRGSGGLVCTRCSSSCDRGVAVEWHRAGDHLVEDQPECVEVDAVIEGPPFHLLRRHVARRAEQLAAACHGGV